MDYKEYRNKYSQEPAQRHHAQKANSRRPVMLAMFLLVLTLVVIFAVLIMTLILRPAYVAGTVTVEAGSRSSVAASDFLTEKEGHTAEFNGTPSFDLGSVGEYTVKLIVDGKKISSKLIVKDTNPPTATVADISIRRGSALKPEDCVSDINDATKVTLSFKKAPDTNEIGRREVTVILEDGGKNKTEYTFILNVVSENGLLYDKYVSELGDPLPDADVFMGREDSCEYISDVSGINTAKIGIYQLQISAGGTAYDVILEIADRTPPTATVTPQIGYNRAPSPESYVDNIVDMSSVTVAYVSEPAFPSEGTVEVDIVLTDAFGNKTVYSTYFTVMNDTTPPEITKAPAELMVNTGEAVIWRASVEAADNSGHVELSLDTSNADLRKPGIYTVTIVAKDPAGNETRRPVKLTVRDGSVTDAMLHAAIAAIEKDLLITDSMNDSDRIYCVFRYVLDNMKYSNTSTHIDIRCEAYTALSGGMTGDCFTYAAVSYALLDYLGYDVHLIERAESAKVEGTGTHFWVLVDINRDKNKEDWYHFDATPQRLPYNLPTYLMTNEQIEAYTRWRNDTYKVENYYTYDVERYPSVSKWQLTSLEIPPQYFQAGE